MQLLDRFLRNYRRNNYYGLRRLADGQAAGVVYMLHHVCSKDWRRIPTNEDLKISPARLEKTIRRSLREGLRPLSLDDIAGGTTTEPFFCFTLDDGYADNLTEALPVFERYGVPFTVFVATDFIDRKAILWWDSVEELLLRGEDVRTSDGQVYRCSSFQQRWDSFRLLRERILKLDQRRLHEELQQMFRDYDIDWLEPVRRQALTWQQVYQLSQHPLCTIGAHTVSHPALNMVSDDEFAFEVGEGKKLLYEHTGKMARHFAFPYGSANEIGERELRLLAPHGFITAWLSYGGAVKEHELKNSPLRLPRVFL